jgi:hypothetical protein
MDAYGCSMDALLLLDALLTLHRFTPSPSSFPTSPSLPHTSLLHSSTPSLLHSFTPSLLLSFTPSLLHSSTPPLLHSFTPSLLLCFSPLLLHSFTPSLLSFTPIFIGLHSFTLSLCISATPALLHSFTPSLPHSFTFTPPHSIEWYSELLKYQDRKFARLWMIGRGPYTAFYIFTVGLH